jgi:anaerobic ribonucleoside-triphosphate reductase activating protein
MLKYLDTRVTFAEVPDEITLCINITGCKIGCKGCHSPYLAEDIGAPLTIEELTKLIDTNDGITCVAIMGGDSKPLEVLEVAWYIKTIWDHLKVAWYSGNQEFNKSLNLGVLDYLKLGPYIAELGPLTSNTTNQRFYHIIHTEDDSDPETFKHQLVDWTYKFQIKGNNVK